MVPDADRDEDDSSPASPVRWGTGAASRIRPLRLRDVCLAVLLGFNLAVAQPLLDILGRNPEFLVAHDAAPIDVILLALGACLVAPLLLALLIWGAHVVHVRLGVAVYALAVTALWGLLATHFLDRLAVPAPVVVVIGLIVGVAVAAAATILRPARRWFAVGAVVPVAALVLFLGFSPASRLLRPAAAAQEAAAYGLEAKPPIVFIVLDEFPLTSLLDEDGEIDETSYPAFSQLGQDGSFYTNATTVDPGTEKAVPAMLTGKLPRPKTVPTSTDHPDNLFTVLSDAYEMDVTEALTRLCPEDVCKSQQRPPFSARVRTAAPDLGIIALHVLLPQFATEGLPPIDQRWRDFAGGVTAGIEWPGIRAQFHRAMRDDRTAGFMAAVERLDERSVAARMHFIHALLPHAPWDSLPSGQRYVTRPGIPGLTGEGKWRNDKWTVNQAYQRHLLQVGYVDRLVGEVIDRLKGAGIYEESLIVVTGDHGVSFVPGQHYRLFDRRTIGGTAWVPLFIKTPGQDQGQEVAQPVSTIDIFPTILDVVGVDAAAYDLDGISLLQHIPAQRDRSVPGQPSWPAFDEAHRDATLAAKHRTFPRMSKRIPAFSLVPAPKYRHLLGKQVPRAHVQEAAGEVLLEHPWGYAALDPSGPMVPAEVRGQLELAAPAGDEVPLALAVNGTIEAVTLALRDQKTGKLLFNGMVPPEALQHGFNTVDPFVITDSGLRPAPVTNGRLLHRNQTWRTGAAFAGWHGTCGRVQTRRTHRCCQAGKRLCRDHRVGGKS